MTLTEKPSETSEVSTPPEMPAGTQFPAQHGTKTTPVFLPTDGQNSWFLLQKFGLQFGLLTVRRLSATRKHLFRYPQGMIRLIDSSIDPVISID